MSAAILDFQDGRAYVLPVQNSVSFPTAADGVGNKCNVVNIVVVVISLLTRITRRQH